MISTCTRRDNWWTNIGSLDFVLRPELEENLEIRRHESYDLNGLKKKQSVDVVEKRTGVITTRRYDESGIYHVGMQEYIWRWKSVGYYARGAGATGLAGRQSFLHKTFAYYVGRKCRTMTVKDVAKELKLDWHTVKALDKEYMQKQLQRNPIAAPGVAGIDERSLRRGHTYRIVVSDLERGRPIWYGGEDRSEESPDMFYEWLGPKKMKKIRLAVTDMWKAFKKSTKRNVPQAAILFDKFHIFLSPKSI